MAEEPSSGGSTAVSTESGADTSKKGLGLARVGLIGATAIGVSCIAPAYTLTSGLGPTISAVGVQVPAILLIGFIPMLLVAFGYRELNHRLPDAGTSFTWVTKAFGPYLGWMAGWGLIAATVIVLSNQAAVGVDFLLIFFGQVFGNPDISALAGNLWVNIPMTVVFMGLAAWISYRGVEATTRMQYALVAVQLIALAIFVVMAFTQAGNGTSPDPTPVQLDWFNPFAIESMPILVAGISLSVFMFWGWDVTLTMNEETKNPERTPGRAAVLSMVVITLVYVTTAVAVIAWGGIGEEGLSAGNPEYQESVFAMMAPEVMGGFAMLMSFAIFASSFASLQSTMVSPARTMLAMGYYGALPRGYGQVSAKTKAPGLATFVAAGASAAFYVVARLLSENALWDTITACGLLVCFYYGITAVASVWYFRRELTNSAKDMLTKGILPGLGGIALLYFFAQTAIDSLDPAYGSGESLFGIGTVFILGVGLLLLGVVVMIVHRITHPGFFKGETIVQIDSTVDTQDVIGNDGYVAAEEDETINDPDEVVQP